MWVKGNHITKENIEDTSTYDRLLNIKEVNYADLKSAAEQIADGNTEAALLTDGEYYIPTKAGANPNNPYLAKAFKTWLKKVRRIIRRTGRGGDDHLILQV